MSLFICYRTARPPSSALTDPLFPYPTRFRSQSGDELVAVDRIEIVGILKAHAEEAPGHAVPEGRAAALVDYPAQLGQNAVGKARAVHGDEQIAAARQQQAQPARAFARMEKQPADLARTFEIGDEAEQDRKSTRLTSSH